MKTNTEKTASQPGQADPLVVRIQRHGAAELEPQIGDTVFEVTHLVGRGLGLLSAIGELVGMENVPGEGKVYVIRTVEGVDQRWLNLDVCVIERKA